MLPISHLLFRVAALFFLTYELMKSISPKLPGHYAPFLHMFAAGMGEVVCNYM